MAFYEVQLRQTVYDQRCLNLFNYFSANPDPIAGGAVDVVETFQTTVVDELINLLRGDLTQFTLDSLYAWDVNDPDDFFEAIYDPGTTGLRIGAGDAAPPFLSYAFRTDRWRVGRNRGYKRLSAICEDDILGNVFDPGGTVVADIEDALAADLTGGLTAYFATVAGKERYVPDPEEPDVFAYRYYDTETAQLAASSSAPLVWHGYRLTTQRSRISGHGP